MGDNKAWPMMANRSQGFRAVGGRLDVADGELRFTPNGFDAITGGNALAVPLARVASVGSQPGRFALGELFSGGLRARLAIDLDDGTRELFVVWNVESAIAAVRAALESDPARG